MALERTLVLFKPDAVQRGLCGRILARFEQKGLKIVGLKLRQFPRDLIEEHYAVHRERPFYAGLVGYMTSGPVLALALEGVDAIEVTRGLMGATNSRQGRPGHDPRRFRDVLLQQPGPRVRRARVGREGAGALLRRCGMRSWSGRPRTCSWIYNVEEELS